MKAQPKSIPSILFDSTPKMKEWYVNNVVEILFEVYRYMKYLLYSIVFKQFQSSILSVRSATYNKAVILL